MGTGLALVLLLAFVAAQGSAPSAIRLIGMLPSGASSSIVRLAVERINADSSILEGVELIMSYNDTNRDPVIASANFLDQITSPFPPIGVVGERDSGVCLSLSYAAGWYKIPQVSYGCTSQTLSGKSSFSFLRGVPSDRKQAQGLVELVNSFQFPGFPNLKVATISTTDEYGTSFQTAFVAEAAKYNITVLQSEQFASGSSVMNITNNIIRLKESGVRIFFSFVIDRDHFNVLQAIYKNKLFGEKYVWFVCGGSATRQSLLNSKNLVDSSSFKAIQGSIGLQVAGGISQKYEDLLRDWRKLDPKSYPGSGSETIDNYDAVAYDVVWAYAYAADALLAAKETLNGANMLKNLKKVNFTGVTGPFSFDSAGDRLPRFDVVNFNGTTRSGDPQTIGNWTIFPGINQTRGNLTVDHNAIYWPSGTNQQPDLGLETKYWSCHDQRLRPDPTGKSVKLERPDEDDADNIKKSYRCDQFIDCQNMSDEIGCSASVIPAMITFGIVTGLLLLLSLLLAVVLLALTFGLKSERVLSSGPFFLLMIILASLLGFVSTYSFYGKPTKASCGFQPWLLGPAIMLLVSTLFVRAVSKFLALRSQYKVLKVNSIKFLFCVTILMVPFIVVLVVWYIVSTPTAGFKKLRAKDGHYICLSEGLVPGLTWIFFFILVGYAGFVLVLGAAFVFVTRSVKTKYNEEQVIALSIYNLTFVGMVAVPVLFVLNFQENVLAYWILLMVAINYAFGSTLFLNFAPVLIGTLKDKLFPPKDDKRTLPNPE